MRQDDGFGLTSVGCWHWATLPTAEHRVCCRGLNWEWWLDQDLPEPLGEDDRLGSRALAMLLDDHARSELLPVGLIVDFASQKAVVQVYGI